MKTIKTPNIILAIRHIANNASSSLKGFAGNKQTSHRPELMAKICALCMTVMLGAQTANAQQDLLLSQEIFSRVNKNPAATGNTEDVDIFLHGRIQWAGIDNGPRTSVLNVTNYVDKWKSGMGFTMSFDKLGVGHNSTNIKLVYAYQVDLSEQYVLSMGLGAGVNLGHFDPGANDLDDQSEYGTDTYAAESDTEVKPDFDFGLELSNEKWTLGASVTHLTRSEMTTYAPERHYYVYGTTLFPLNDAWELAPTVSYMHRNKTNVMEVGSLVFYDRTIWGGATLRPDLNSYFNPSMLVLTLGFEWNKLRFGYSFDLGLGKLTEISSTTHEIILSYGIDKSKRKGK